MRIKQRHLEVFSALIEAGSVSRAAQRLNLSQPAVSIALSNLEKDLGFQLFHRDRGYFAPTSEAMQLQQEVAQGLMALARVEQRADEIRAGTTGAISIATNGVLSMHFLPRLIARFQQEYPGTRIEVRVHSSRQIASWVSGRQIDIGLIDQPIPVGGLEAELYYMECVCIMREDDPLAQNTQITPELLKDRTVVAITGDHVVDRQLEQYMSEANIRLEHSASSYYYPIARNLVAEGNSVSIIDPVNGKAQLGDGVVWRPFAPRVVHEQAVITSKDQPLGNSAERFKSALRDQLQDYVLPEAPVV